MGSEVRARVAILVAGDSGARGERADRSGQALAESLAEAGHSVLERTVVPDDLQGISAELCRICDELGPDLVFTCGGTGFTARDAEKETTEARIHGEEHGCSKSCSGCSRY